MAHLVVWDAKYNFPVVDGKVMNPTTGLVEDAGSEGYRAGPPRVDVIWHNMDSTSDFFGSRASFAVSIDDVYLEIAKHIKDGIYSIVSISASAYAFHIICKTKKTQEEFHNALVKMVESLAKDLQPWTVDVPKILKEGDAVATNAEQEIRKPAL